jgi:hypothetical protein
MFHVLPDRTGGMCSGLLVLLQPLVTGHKQDDAAYPAYAAHTYIEIKKRN